MRLIEPIWPTRPTRPVWPMPTSRWLMAALLWLSNFWVSCLSLSCIWESCWLCSHSPSQNVLHSSPKIRDILEFVLTYVTISWWWSNASINLNVWRVAGVNCAPSEMNSAINLKESALKGFCAVATINRSWLKLRLKRLLKSLSLMRSLSLISLLRLTFKMVFDDQAATKFCCGFLWCSVLLFNGRKSLCCTPQETDNSALFFLPFEKQFNNKLWRSAAEDCGLLMNWSNNLLKCLVSSWSKLCSLQNHHSNKTEK